MLVCYKGRCHHSLNYSVYLIHGIKIYQLIFLVFTFSFLVSNLMIMNAAGMSFIICAYTIYFQSLVLCYSGKIAILSFKSFFILYLNPDIVNYGTCHFLQSETSGLGKR
jgi:hypothetical protein